MVLTGPPPRALLPCHGCQRTATVVVVGGGRCVQRIPSAVSAQLPPHFSLELPGQPEPQLLSAILGQFGGPWPHHTSAPRPSSAPP